MGNGPWFAEEGDGARAFLVAGESSSVHPRCLGADGLFCPGSLPVDGPFAVCPRAPGTTAVLVDTGTNADCAGPSWSENPATQSSQVKNYSPGNMEHASSRGHEASPQSGLGVGCKRCSSSKKLPEHGNAVYHD